MKALQILALPAACLAALTVHAQVANTAQVQPAPGRPPIVNASELKTQDASAGDWERPRIGIHVGSRHEPVRRPNGQKFNNSNPGVYLRWDNGVTVGGYRNSEYRTSVYAGWTWASSACGPAVTFGVITGYAKGTIPLIVPSLCVLDHVRLSFIPKIEPKGSNVLHLSLEF
jgi:hypothetical protein